jgi:DnaK suppressor protein
MIDLNEMKKVLLMKQEELQQRITNTQAAEREETKGEQDDNAQLWEASEIRDDLDDEAAAELGEVQQALVRLDAGQYGACASCGKPIGETRIKAVPYASLCITCAEATA